MKYLCLVYEEEAKVDALPEDESSAISDEELDYLEELRRNGHCLASARLQPTETAATIRVHNGSLSISDAQVIGAKERLGGFHLIDARDLNDAIRIAAKLPRARLGSIEVRPLEECHPGWLRCSRNPGDRLGSRRLARTLCPIRDYDGESSGLQV